MPRKTWKWLALSLFALGLVGCLGHGPSLQAVIRTTPFPPQGPYPLSVTFDGTDSKGAVTEWVWTFFRLEGTEEVPLGLSLSGPTVEYVFETRGRYRVYLDVRSEDQAFDQTFVDIDVRSKTPLARFTVDPYPDVQEGKIVHFDASDSFDPDGAVVSYVWSFGDGFWEETRDPKVSHVYSKPGEYWVQLVVEDDYGDRSEPAVARVRVVPKGCGSCP